MKSDHSSEAARNEHPKKEDKNSTDKKSPSRIHSIPSDVRFVKDKSSDRSTEKRTSSKNPQMNRSVMTHSSASISSGQSSTSSDSIDGDDGVKGNGTSLSGSSSTDGRGAGSNDNSGDSSSNNNHGSKNNKTERSKLRKGKWSVEEEDYTSRIIRYFRAGLLTLPEGATLRSYLAEKLNCDPMRITKKYAGASCLGRRVYHNRDRIPPQPPTLSEVHLARVELDLLENRFRMSVEAGEGGAMPPDNASSLLTPGLPTGPNAIAQTMELIGQQLQQQQQAAIVAATLAATAAQQNSTTVSQMTSAVNPLQALLLSLAAAAGGASQLPTGGGSVQAVPASVSSANQMQQQPQPQQAFSLAAVGWPSQQPPAPAAVPALPQPPAAALPPQPIFQPSAPSLSAATLAQHNRTIDNNSLSVPPSTMSLWQTPSPVQVEPQQQQTNVDQYATTMAILTKVLGPAIAQAAVAAAAKQRQSPEQKQYNPPSVQQQPPAQSGLQQQLQPMAALHQTVSFQHQQLQQKQPSLPQQQMQQASLKQENPAPALQHAQGQPTNPPTQLSAVLSQLQNFRSQLQQIQQQHNIQPMQQQQQQQFQPMQQQQFLPMQQQMPAAVQNHHMSGVSQQQPKTVNPATDQQTHAFALRLKEAYEQQFQQLNGSTAGGKTPAGQGGNNFVGSITNGEGNSSTQSTGNQRQLEQGLPKAVEGKTDGNVLVGFLTSLRQSYEDALRAQDESSNPRSGAIPSIEDSSGVNAQRLSDLASIVALATTVNHRMTTTVTDSASSTQNQPESSGEDYSDWNSDKKTDPSSSEDSDKETKMNARDFDSQRYSNAGKGPPRKRIKTSNCSK